MITIQQFSGAVPCSIMTATTWHPHVVRALDRWSVNTRRRAAGLIATMSHESARFSTFEENLNYGAQGLANTWPSRFAVNPRVRPRVPNDLAKALQRNKRLIANNVYADRMGNGSVASGDGWRNRGRGPIQITGAENYQKYFAAAGLPPDSDPDLLLDPHYGADSSGWYWSSRGCNELMDAGDFLGATKVVNGGTIGYEDGNEEGVDDRVEHYVLACRVLGISPNSTENDQ